MHAGMQLAVVAVERAPASQQGFSRTVPQLLWCKCISNPPCEGLRIRRLHKAVSCLAAWGPWLPLSVKP